MNFAVVLSLILAILAGLSVFIWIPFVSEHAFWVAGRGLLHPRWLRGL
jgi:hypothetical protein